MPALLALLPQLIALVAAILKGTQTHDAPVETQANTLSQVTDALTKAFQNKDSAALDGIINAALAPIVHDGNR